MFNDFPAKFEELQRLLRERKEDEMRERGKGECYLIEFFIVSCRRNPMTVIIPSDIQEINS